MAFPKKYLNDSEEVIRDLRPHWFFLFGPAVALIAALALAIWMGQAEVSEVVLFPVLALAAAAVVLVLLLCERSFPALALTDPALRQQVRLWVETHAVEQLSATIIGYYFGSRS